MRTKTLAAGVAVAAIAAGWTVSMVSADEPADPINKADCLGLDCVQPGSRDDVPESRDPAPSVLGPEQLEKQTRAGFYEYGQGTTLHERAVAYVMPTGQLDQAPASVRDLPVVQSLANGGDFQRGTVVIFGPDTSLSTVPAPKASTTTKKPSKRRLKARKAAQDAYGCEDNYFCIYDCELFDCARLQFGPSYTGQGWQALGDYAFNDKAQSMRNRRDRDSLLARHWPAGDSTRYCADSHSSDTTFGNNPIGANEASSFANVPDDIHC